MAEEIISLQNSMNERDMVKEIGRVGGFAYGGYLCKCHNCQRGFFGDKRAYSCLPCEVKMLQIVADREFHLGD